MSRSKQKMCNSPIVSVGGREEDPVVPDDGIASPGTGGDFQSTFSVADHVGTPVSLVTPLRSGPRQPGQFSDFALGRAPRPGAAVLRWFEE